MPLTSNWNIWTPDDADNYDFIVDAAATAQTVDDALTDVANAFKGTVAERTAFTSTAVDGMLWQDTDGIKMIWRKDGAIWVPAVWRWSGTNTQMTGFAPPDGFEWFNTTDNSIYTRLSGAWSPSIGSFTPGSGMTVIGNSSVKRDPGGHVTGLMRVTGTITNAKTIATLSSGFRPAVPVSIGGVSTGGGTAWSPFDITTSGAIIIYSPFAASPTGATLQFSFQAA